MDDETYAVVALVRYRHDGDLTTTTVRLAKGRETAKRELKRMVGVVLQEKAQVEMGEMWARVKLKNGIDYEFHAHTTSWVEKDEARHA